VVEISKETGLGWTTCSVDNSAGVLKAIVNDVKSLEFATPREEIDVTGLDKSGKERLLGLADFTISLEGAAFNDAADASHDVFKTVGSSDATRTVTLVVSGQTLTNECVFTEASWERDDKGAFTWKAEGALANGTAPTWT
jgi:hypothetical protein